MALEGLDGAAISHKKEMNMYAKEKLAGLSWSCVLALVLGALIGLPSGASAFDLQPPIGSESGLISLAPLAETSPAGLAAAEECKRTSRASRYFPNGTLDQLMKYVYSKAGQLTRTNSFDGADTSQLESCVTYKYKTNG